MILYSIQWVWILQGKILKSWFTVPSIFSNVYCISPTLDKNPNYRPVFRINRIGLLQNLTSIKYSRLNFPNRSPRLLTLPYLMSPKEMCLQSGWVWLPGIFTHTWTEYLRLCGSLSLSVSLHVSLFPSLMLWSLYKFAKFVIWFFPTWPQMSHGFNSATFY